WRDVVPARARHLAARAQPESLPPYRASAATPWSCGLPGDSRRDSLKRRASEPVLIAAASAEAATEVRVDDAPAVAAGEELRHTPVLTACRDAGSREVVRSRRIREVDRLGMPKAVRKRVGPHGGGMLGCGLEHPDDVAG